MQWSSGASTSTALTQITDWLREIDTKIVGAVLLDFSAAFDIIDKSAAGKTYICYGFCTVCGSSGVGA